MQEKKEYAQAIGIDGCRGGWCLIYERSEKQIELVLLSDLREALNLIAGSKISLIDIPLGLGSKRISRTLESIARGHLKPKRTSSIFTPPVFECLKSKSYRDACMINQKMTGKKISIQSWNILPKISEANELIFNRPELKSNLKEAHPEICFQYLNHGQPLLHSKSAGRGFGIKERLEILMRYYGEVEQFFNQSSIRYPKSKLKEDDILDAFCLFITAKLGLKNGFQVISGENKFNEQDIEMSMYYAFP